MNAREILEGTIRTDRGDMTVHSPVEARARLDAYRAEILAKAADYFEQRRPSRADAVSDFDRGRRATVGWVVEELREKAGEKATPHPLTDAERTFLTFALDLAADRMLSRSDEFTDEDDAALKTFRRMAGEQ